MISVLFGAFQQWITLTSPEEIQMPSRPCRIILYSPLVRGIWGMYKYERPSLTIYMDLLRLFATKWFIFVTSSHMHLSAAC